MEPVLVACARGVVDDVIEVLCEASKDLGHTIWSLEGNPCSMHPSRPAIAMRMCIVDAEKVDPHHIPEAKILGSAHIVRVAHIPAKCRVTIYREDLSGAPVASPNEGLLRLFCNRFARLLEAKGIRMSGSRSKSETGPFTLPPLAQNDTDPLST